MAAFTKVLSILCLGFCLATGSAAFAADKSKKGAKKPKQTPAKNQSSENNNETSNKNTAETANQANQANQANNATNQQSNVSNSKSKNANPAKAEDNSNPANENFGMQENAAPAGGDQAQGTTEEKLSQGEPTAAVGDDDEFGEDEEAKNERDNQAFFYDIRRNPHPRSPSSHATKRLILTFLKPKEEKLNLCVKEFRAAADTATNADSIVQTMKLMTAAVSRNVKFYHWCFYHFVTALDWKLEEDSLGLQLQDKMTIFTKNMKGLWLLSRSLDEAVKSHIYFDFVKVRYVELSLSHFGRSLDVISPPLGDPRWIEPTKYFRPSGAFEQ